MKSNIVVIKIGSQLVLENKALSERFFAALFTQIKHLTEKGWQPVIVLSGAVARGKAIETLTGKHARAAFGQLELARVCSEAGEKNKVRSALILVTKDDIVNRAAYDTLQRTLAELAHAGIIAIINENDATTLVGVNDFVDNDQLASIIALMIHADRLILMTNVEGVFSANPATVREAHLIAEIKNINLEIIKRTLDGSSEHGRGGMDGKLRAARIATAVGIATHIVKGTDPLILTDILVSGKKHGTLCRARGRDLKDFTTRERWIVSAQNSGASVELDAGAAEAVKARKSLLAVGIQKVFGTFEEKECIELLDADKETVALGLSEISSKRLNELLGQKEKQYDVKVVHANNLRLL